MPVASLVLAFLLGTSPEASLLAHAPSSGSGPASEPRTEPAQAVDGAQGSPEGEPAAPAPGGASEGDGGWDRAPASEQVQPVLVDPWASVPLQTAVPTRPPTRSVVVQPVVPRSHVSAPLLDPWAGGTARRHAPRQLDPELRDPFHGMRPRSEAPRVASADLRDPFARRDADRRDDARRVGPAERAAAPAIRSAPPEPLDPRMPTHPDLRDPFGRRKARPAPPPSGAAPDPVPRPPAPPSLPREPSGELRPGALVPGALLPSAGPFAHLPRTRRPA